jgi:outer membrane PBP1 activator LpoA protein
MAARLRYHFDAMQIRFNETAPPILSRLATLALVLLLSACAGTGPAPDHGAAPTGAGEAAFAGGDYRGAALAWQQAALNAAPGDAASLRISAADAWLLAGEPQKAEDLLRWIKRRELKSEDRARLDLVLADLALRGDRPDEAEILLRKAEPALPWSSKARHRDLNAQMQRQLSRPGSRDLGEAARLAESMAFYDPSAAVELVRALEDISSSELAIRAANPRGDRELAGWLDLTLVIRQNLVEPFGVTRAVSAWKNRHPYHRLTAQQALDTWLRYRQLFALPARVAVLLPASGRLQSAGSAIRDGFMSAYLDHPGGTEVLFFATGDDEESTIAAYFNALDAGADFIVGPLRKESVAAMLGLAGLSTPVLALNDLPEPLELPAGLASQVSGMSLSQDREVLEIAEHMSRSGFENAMVIAPENAWGERIAYTFESGFLHEERKIIAAARFPEAQNDHSALLERLLRIDRSKLRRRQLENTLQISLEFEPVRRDDIDAIFLAASSAQARLIRPQLRFHDAGDIPVYATGRVYSGQPDPARNQDLDGVRFPAAPWQLSHPERDDIPDLASVRKGTLGVLFALGQDAWSILPWLALMQKDPDFSFPGQSGHYRYGSGGNLIREPAWAEFSRGRPVALQQRPVASGR